MKKLFMILLCVIMMTAVTSIVAFAEDGTTESLTITEQIVNYAKEHVEEALTMIAAIASAFFVKLISGKLSNAVGTLNNNSITIANTASEKLSAAAKKLEQYEEKMSEFLSEFQRSEEEKKHLEDMIDKSNTVLETSKLALIELGNEFAELLMLANIPNAKKESFYASHKEAMKKLEEAEGVINND